MTLLLTPSANAVARQVEPESFRDFAHQELEVCAPWQAGICFRPECGAEFVPSRQWQIYCCQACERAGVAELRKWGHRMALSALVWRMGKYNREDEGVINLTRAARRHLTQLQSAWVADRSARAAERGL